MNTKDDLDTIAEIHGEDKIAFYKVQSLIRDIERKKYPLCRVTFLKEGHIFWGFGFAKDMNKFVSFDFPKVFEVADAYLLSCTREDSDLMDIEPISDTECIPCSIGEFMWILESCKYTALMEYVSRLERILECLGNPNTTVEDRTSGIFDEDPSVQDRSLNI